MPIASHDYNNNGNGKNDINQASIFSNNGDKFTELSKLLNIREEDLLQDNSSDGSNGKYKKAPYQYNKDIWHLGWTDGRYGQPSETNLKIIALNAQLEGEQELSELEGKIAGKEATLACLNYELQHLEPQLNKRRELFEEIWLDKARNRYLYSIVLAGFFLFSAVVLFAADIPLTLRLVASGFGIRTEVPLAGKIQSINDGFDFWALPYFWEAILLAGGLLFVGIYVKFFLDKIIFREKNEQPLNWIIKTFLISTMLLFLATFIVLGIFRAQQQDILLKERIAKEVDNQINKDKKRNPQFTVSSEERRRLIKEKYDERKEFQSSWMSIAFILLTLLFPLVGGLCFSVCFRHIYKVISFRGIRKDFYRTKNLFDVKILEQKQLQYSIKSKLAELEYKKANQARIESIAKLQENLYLHGYLRGSKMKRTLEEGSSLYERCESLIENKLAEKSRDFIWSSK